MKKILIHTLLLSLLFLTVILPNSFTFISFSLQVLLSIVICLLHFKFSKYLFDYWALISLCFFFFIVLSPLSVDQQMNLVLRYIISPFTWLIIFHYIKSSFDYKIILRAFVILSFVSCLSVIIFYILFYNGIDFFIHYIIEDPNLDSSTGFGFRLHVYGVLIFFAMALVPTMRSIESLLFRFIYFIFFLIAVILSGRTALILSFVFGSVFFLNKLTIPNLLKVSVGLMCIIYFVSTIEFGINDNTFLHYLTENHLEKLTQGGGEARSIQLAEIINVFISNPLGVGFISLGIIRNDFNNWQYETLIPVLVMRFGLVTIMIIIVVFYLIWKRIRGCFCHQNAEYRHILLLGFAGIFLASFTNPYLEAPAFQWMFIGPIVLLHKI